MPAVELLLVRHGESTWNAVGRWQGWADPPLSDLGRAQAEAAAPAAGTVDLVVASDLERARRTAEIMATALAAGPVVVEPGVRERDVGEFTGLTRVEIEERWPGVLGSVNASIAADGRFGETAEALNGRVLEALWRQADASDGSPARATGSGQARILVVTHGGVVRSLERALGIEPGPLPNLGGRILTLDLTERTIQAGERVLLLDPDVVPVTVPGQL
ncbi:hypothetical protein BH18ACT1_BH18ACT1_04780 [soil metagenome]